MLTITETTIFRDGMHPPRWLNCRINKLKITIKVQRKISRENDEQIETYHGSEALIIWGDMENGWEK